MFIEYLIATIMKKHMKNTKEERYYIDVLSACNPCSKWTEAKSWIKVYTRRNWEK